MSRAGQFLIATPQLKQEFFARSVVFVYEDSDTGTAGLVINRNTNTADFADLAADRGMVYPRGVIPIYTGGPVNIRAVTMLHSAEWYSENSLPINDQFTVSSDNLMITKLIDGNTPKYHRLCAGASVWAPGQLDREIAQGNWLISDLPNKTVFQNTGDRQWEQCIEAAGQALVASWF